MSRGWNSARPAHRWWVLRFLPLARSASAESLRRSSSTSPERLMPCAIGATCSTSRGRRMLASCRANTVTRSAACASGDDGRGLLTDGASAAKTSRPSLRRSGSWHFSNLVPGSCSRFAASGCEELYTMRIAGCTALEPRHTVAGTRPRQEPRSLWLLLPWATRVCATIAIVGSRGSECFGGQDVNWRSASRDLSRLWRAGH
jgi:hypothetical protein